jgi:hypothetical protein
MKINYTVVKRSFHYLFVVAIALYLVTLSACKDKPDPDPTPEPEEPTQAEKVVSILTGGNATWPLTSVTIDGENGAELFKDFSIKFTATGYTTTGTTPVWKRTGTWTFTNDDATAFKREDNVVVTITSISETQLKLSLNWTETTHEGGRVQSLAGKHEFILSK